jgi:hypothetical protein
MYLLHYCNHNDACRELTLLSINTFQKDVTNQNQFIRATALRILINIKSEHLLDLQMSVLKAASRDRWVSMYIMVHNTFLTHFDLHIRVKQLCLCKKNYSVCDSLLFKPQRVK